MQYYLLVVCVWPIIAWVIAVTTGNAAAFFAAAFLSVIAGGLSLLRLLRGSLLEHEVEQQHYRQIVDNPYIVSNRIGKHRERNEQVIWETRLHPLALVSIWWRHATSGIGLAVFGGYILIVAGLWFADGREGFSIPWWIYAILLVLAAGYVAFTVIEWNCEWYAVTTRRIIAVHGIFRTQYLVMTRAAITDCWTITPTTSHFLAWLRVIRAPYGTWNLETPGQKQALNSIKFIPDAAVHMTTFPPKP